MTPKIEATRSGKNHAIITVNGEEFCTIYGNDWNKNFKKLKDALCLDYVVKNLTLKDVNAVIKELRK